MNLKYRISIIVLSVSLFLGIVQATNKNGSGHNDFLLFIHEKLPEILDKNSQLKGLYSSVKVLEDGGPSFINSVYLILLKNGQELILKISNPVWKRDKTLNEVAALKFLKANTRIPVPEVLTYESDINQSSILNEYIIMPRVKGKPLNQEIDKIYENRKDYYELLDQLALHITELKKFNFSYIGNFFYKEDGNLLVKGIVDFANYEIKNPCKNYSEYARHAVKFYSKEMQISQKKENSHSWIYTKYIPILENFILKADFSILDKDDRFFFSHQDFVMKNILVHENTVTAILDWEWSGSALIENESMTGFDFLKTLEDKIYFSKALKKYGVDRFFDPPPLERQLFYRLIGNIYTLVAFKEWKEGKLEHTAKFLTQKLEQRKIRNDPNFNMEEFIFQVMTDLDECLELFPKIKTDN